jgi:hypothetical protein
MSRDMATHAATSVDLGNVSLADANDRKIVERYVCFSYD